MTEQRQGQQRETTMQMPGKAHIDPRCGCGECVGYLTAWETVCSPLMLELATLRSAPAVAATSDYIPDRHRDSIHIADLSPDAQEVLRRVVAKFRTGATEHGPLSVTSRRWGPELLNEAIDMLHYAIFELMRLERVAEAAPDDDDGLPLGGQWEAPSVANSCNCYRLGLRRLDGTLIHTSACLAARIAAKRASAK